MGVGVGHRLREHIPCSQDFLPSGKGGQSGGVRLWQVWVSFYGLKGAKPLFPPQSLLPACLLCLTPTTPQYFIFFHSSILLSGLHLWGPIPASLAVL